MLLISCPDSLTKCGRSQPSGARLAGVASGSIAAAVMDWSSVSMIRVIVTSPMRQRCHASSGPWPSGTPAGPGSA